MNRRQLARWRMHALGMSAPRFESPESVVRHLGAVQAQEFPLSLWSVGMRCGADVAALYRALADGRILRTHVLRPTWHYVLADDILWMQELTAERVLASVASYERRLELGSLLLDRSLGVIARALEGGHQRTRAELSDALDAAGIQARSSRLAHIVMHAELRGLICSGVPRGTLHTYALIAERAPNARRLERDEALAELARRYFASHGPATLKDFRWWSGLRAADTTRATAALGDEVRRVEADGRTYLHIGHVPDPPPRASRVVHLLQGYDEYVVAYTESRDVLDVDGHARNIRSPHPPFTHAVILDGQVIGHWRGRPWAGRDSIELEVIRPLTTADRRALDAATSRITRFFGC